MPERTTLPDPPFRFTGVTSPNTTQVPDQYLDELLPILSGAELKVLLYITRRTFGFKKASDNISLSQMLNGITTRDGRVLDSGVGLTKKTLLQAIASLEAMNIVLRQRRSSVEKGHEPTAYCLNIASGSSRYEAETGPLGEKLHQGGGGKTTPSPRGKNSPTQHTVQQHTDFETSKGEQGREADESDQTARTPTKPHRSGSSSGLEAIGTSLSQRVRPWLQADDSAAISATVEQLADELGDGARLKSSVTRAMRLFAGSGLHRDVFIDALHQAKGEVRDRRRNPGKAPQPRNQMAYFFAVVEDRLGLKSEKGSSQRI